MIVLDLCSGTGSATKAFRDRGHIVDTLDIIGNPTYLCDVRQFKLDKKYDFIWASPPCTCFSVAGLRVHWKDHKPQAETLEAIEILKACIKICQTAPIWIIENPRGMMRKLDCMKPFFRNTVTYCQYGDSAMKPTDLFNNFGFQGKSCKSGMKCHTSAPRSTTLKGSTQWKSKVEQAKVPYGLSLEICKAVELI